MGREAKILEGIKEKIIGYFEDKNPILIYIFGSYAKGNSTAESDIDIAVYLESSIKDIDIYYYKRDLVDILGLEVDLIDLRNANIIIQNQIVTKGINIFTKTKLEQGEYKYRIISNYNQYREDVEIVKQNIKKRGWVWKK